MTEEATAATGTVEFALRHAAKLLTDTPVQAIEQAVEILKVAPDHPVARLLVGAGRRRCSQWDAAMAVLAGLVQHHPGWAVAHYELGMAYSGAGRGEQAVAALRTAVQLKEAMPDAWRALADHLTVLGDTEGATRAYSQQIKHSVSDPRLVAAATAVFENRIPEAEHALRQHLIQFPTDVVAIRLFAEVAARLERYVDAENLLARCLELAPNFAAARRNYATVLHRQHKNEQALAVVEQLLACEPRDPTYRNLQAAILGALGQYDASIELYAGILAEYPHHETVWLNYGHALKTAGRQSESIDAYRRCIELAPQRGAAYWSLANLKTFEFLPADLEAMQMQLLRADLPAEERLQFHFAAGKALEDAQEFARSFEHYARANELRRTQVAYSAERTTARFASLRQLFTHEFFSSRRGYGHPSAEPIFIVGLPRAGSTLLEQILASHSQVEGTMELPDLISIARAAGARSTGSGYVEALAQLSAEDCRALGQRYLDQTRIQRRAGSPYFIDKMPNNFAYVGFIQLILPNARIIDARRHPLACCLSLFKQHFARGQHFAYQLTDLGYYYRDYVALMSHFDQVLPGRVHRVFYESLVSDTENQIRELLRYCGLQYEADCLRFHENRRAVRTASSEQVRRPIYREALDHWRHFEPWLGALKQALGPALESYPRVM